MEVDVYGPVDILCYVNDEDLLWHGVMPILSQTHSKSSSDSRGDSGPESFLQSIRGTSLNQFLLIYFNVCGQEYRLHRADDASKIQLETRGDPLEFPGGDRSLWLSSINDVYTFCSTMCPISFIIVRIEHLVKCYTSGENSSTVFDDTVTGAIEFLLNWTKGYSQFMDLKQLLELRRFTTRILKILRDRGNIRLTSRIQLLGEEVEKECCETTLKGPDNRYIPALPTNNSIQIMTEQKKKKRWKEEQEALARQKEIDEFVAAQEEAKAKAEAEAEAAKSKSSPPPDGYVKGQRVLYNDTDECIVVGRHMDDYPSIYYTIQLPDGREKQTVAEKLTLIDDTTPDDANANKGNTAKDDPNYVPAIFGLNLDGDSDEDSISDFDENSIDEMKRAAEETAARYKRDHEEEENRKKEQEDEALLMEEKTDPTLKVSPDNASNLVPYALSFLPPTFSFHGDPKGLYYDLFAMNVYEIARQWTLVDQKLFASIPLTSFMNKKWSNPRHTNESALIRKFIDRFNATSFWTTMTLLKANAATTTQIMISEGRNQEISDHVLAQSSVQGIDMEASGTPEDRARMYTWLIELAASFDGLNNFSGMIAVLSGLQQPSITRLKSTLQLVSEKTRNTFQRLQTLCAVSKNYSAYRSELGRRVESLQDDETDSVEYDQKRSQVEFAETTAGNIFSSWGIEFSIKHPLARGTTGVVPHLGPHLHEIVAIDEGNSDRIPDFPSLINLKKKMLLARTVSFLRELQQLTYHSSMAKVEKDGRVLGNGKKFLRPVRRIISMIGLHLQQWVDLNSSRNAKRNETDKHLYALSQSLEDSNDISASKVYQNVSSSKDVDYEYDYSTGFPSPTQQQQSQSQHFQQQQEMGHTTSNSKNYAPPKSSDGIRRYNNRGEETDSLVSSDYGFLVANRGGGASMFSYLFGGNRGRQ